MHLVAQPHDGKGDRETETAGQQHHAPEIMMVRRRVVVVVTVVFLVIMRMVMLVLELMQLSSKGQECFR